MNRSIAANNPLDGATLIIVWFLVDVILSFIFHSYLTMLKRQALRLCDLDLILMEIYR